MANEALAFQNLATADVAQLRLSGLILAALVQKGLLTNAQVRSLVDDTAKTLPGSHQMQPAFAALKGEFP